MKRLLLIVITLICCYSSVAFSATFEEIKLAAEQGDAKAQVTLGFLYEKGRGVRQDYHKAREWYEKAAVQGLPEAQMNLGILYNQGRGVRQDYQKAGEWYEKAAAQGADLAQISLGLMYVQGKGVRKNLATAKEYLASGQYLWNSGMFVWKASTILHYFEELLPDVYACLKQIGAALGTEKEQEVLHEVYPTIPKISVDYGIMERAKGVLMLEGDFGWNDVGSWDTLDAVRTRDAAGNISSGDTLLLDAKNCVVYGGKKLIAAVGVENLVIVEGRDSILVCPVDQAQRVKEVVETLEKEGRTERL